MLEYIWDQTAVNTGCSGNLVVLGGQYCSVSNDTDKAGAGANSGSGDSVTANGIQGDGGHTRGDELVARLSENLKSFFHSEKQLESQWPTAFIDDVLSRTWLTYRTGFPPIERDKNGPSVLNLGSLLRGTLDLSNSSKGFTTDAGWGCMIRTSQSLLANSLMMLKLGRDWIYNPQDVDSTDADLKKHWEILMKFNDDPAADYSIHKFVSYAARHCGKRPGEWFGPSDAAKSIQGLCNGIDDDLKVYLSSDSGDIYQDELFKISNWGTQNSKPVLILSGIRLGVKSVNAVYWDFLKYLLSIPNAAGIAGGRPSSSHYFFGYQDDYFFYLDPHTPQKSLPLSHENLEFKELQQHLSTFHTKKIRKLHLTHLDPSMLVGILIKDENDYNQFAKKLSAFDPSKRFLNISQKRMSLISRDSTGLGFDSNEALSDLGVESLEDDDDEEEENDALHASSFANKNDEIPDVSTSVAEPLRYENFYTNTHEKGPDSLTDMALPSTASSKIRQESIVMITDADHKEDTVELREEDFEEDPVVVDDLDIASSEKTPPVVNYTETIHHDRRFSDAVLISSPK